MKTNTNKDMLLNSIGLACIATLLIATINPLNWDSLRIVSDSAINIMFIFLALGFISFLLRKNFMILVNFSACIAMCTYLKQAQNSDFNYTTATSNTQISIANFVLNDTTSIHDFKEQLPLLQADLISVQVPVRYMESNWSRPQEQTDFSYCSKTICGDSLAVIIFSNTVIHNLDTLCFDNAISIAGAIKIEGIEKEVAFISTHVPNKGTGTHEQLALLSNYIQSHYTDLPLVTLSGSDIKPWMPEMQTFKTDNSLSDSRMDIDFYDTNKHIFFSEDLVCTHFDNIWDGKGITATYQLKKIAQSQVNQLEV